MSFRPLAAAALLAVLAGCGGKEPVRRRVAILPTEVLGGGATWLQQDIPLALALQLDGFPAAAPAETAPRGADLLLHTWLESAGGRARLHYALESATTRRTVARGAAAAAGGAAGADTIDAVALAVDARRRPRPTASLAALHEYALGLAAADPAAQRERFRAALAADAHFELAAARLAAIEARAARDRGAYTAALEKTARLAATDAAAWRDAGGAAYGGREFARAASLLAKAVAIAPSDAALRLALGYAQAFAGDLPAATATLAEYGKLTPDSANALDSLGEVYFRAGKFPEAERYFLDCYKKDPSFLGGAALRKAAFAQWHAGNRGGADKRFAEYVAARKKANAALARIEEAQWQSLQGRRQEAAAALETARRGWSGDAAALAALQLALWTGRPALAAEARRGAQTPGVAALALTVQFVLLPDASPAVWRERAQETFPQPPAAALRQTALAYALTRNRHWAAAAEIWRAIYAATDPGGDGLVREFLGLSLLELGRRQEAAELLSVWPIPASAQYEPFLDLIYPSLLERRAALR